MPTVSTYCSRNWLFTIASTKLRMPRFCVYQLGRGSEPVIVVGSILSLVARSMAAFLPGLSLPALLDREARKGNRRPRASGIPSRKNWRGCPPGPSCAGRWDGSLKPSLRLDAQILGGLFPHRKLLLQECRRILRRADAVRLQIKTELHRQLLNLPILGRTIDRGIDLFDDVGRRAGRRNQHEPALEIETRQAFGSGRYVRQAGGALVRGHRDRAQRPCLHVRFDDRYRKHTNLRAAGHDILDAGIGIR